MHEPCQPRPKETLHILHYPPFFYPYAMELDINMDDFDLDDLDDLDGSLTGLPQPPRPNTPATPEAPWRPIMLATMEHYQALRKPLHMNPLQFKYYVEMTQALWRNHCWSFEYAMGVDPGPGLKRAFKFNNLRVGAVATLLGGIVTALHLSTALQHMLKDPATYAEHIAACRLLLRRDGCQPEWEGSPDNKLPPALSFAYGLGVDDADCRSIPTSDRGASVNAAVTLYMAAIHNLAKCDIARLIHREPGTGVVCGTISLLLLVGINDVAKALDTVAGMWQAFGPQWCAAEPTLTPHTQEALKTVALHGLGHVFAVMRQGLSDASGCKNYEDWASHNSAREIYKCQRRTREMKRGREREESHAAVRAVEYPPHPNNPYAGETLDTQYHPPASEIIQRPDCCVKEIIQQLDLLVAESVQEVWQMAKSVFSQADMSGPWRPSAGCFAPSAMLRRVDTTQGFSLLEGASNVRSIFSIPISSTLVHHFTLKANDAIIMTRLRQGLSSDERDDNDLLFDISMDSEFWNSILPNSSAAAAAPGSDPTHKDVLLSLLDVPSAENTALPL